MISDSTIPKITILMAVHNGQSFLRQSVGSVLSQKTFTNLEIIIIDDASTDQTASILQFFPNPSIKVIRNKSNLGLTRSLNFGLAHACGEWVARMDADDVSLSHRINSQYNLMKGMSANVCFCNAFFENTDTGDVTLWQAPEWIVVLWRSLFSNSYGFHSAVMFRRDTVMALGGYDEKFVRAQDYDLFDRLVASGERFVYVPEPLLHYRFTPEGISRKHAQEQEKFAREVSYRAMRRLLPDATDEELRLLRWLFLDREILPDSGVTPGLPKCLELIHSFLCKYRLEGSARLVWSEVANSLVVRIGLIKSKVDCTLIHRLLWTAAIRSGSPRSIYRAARAVFNANLA